VCILSFKSVRCGRADLIIIPPIECPIKLSHPSWDPGHQSLIKLYTSLASLSPILEISDSEWPSFELEHRKWASGRRVARVFLNSLTSFEVAWNPWTNTNKCYPLYLETTLGLLFSRTWWESDSKLYKFREFLTFLGIWTFSSCIYTSSKTTGSYTNFAYSNTSSTFRISFFDLQVDLPLDVRQVQNFLFTSLL
jgi:hypothetical protein